MNVRMGGGGQLKRRRSPASPRQSKNRKYSAHKAVIGSVKLNNAQVKIMLMRHMTRERNDAEACLHVRYFSYMRSKL